MAKSEFLNDIFAEFDKRLKTVIDQGYCGLTLEVENNLKAFLATTIRSSATIQANVSNEITAMKDYVIEVATEAEKGVTNGRTSSYSDISPNKDKAPMDLNMESSTSNELIDHTPPINMEAIDVNSLETSDIADTSTEDNAQQSSPSDEEEGSKRENVAKIVDNRIDAETFSQPTKNVGQSKEHKPTSSKTKTIESKKTEKEKKIAKNNKAPKKLGRPKKQTNESTIKTKSDNSNESKNESKELKKFDSLETERQSPVVNNSSCEIPNYSGVDVREPSMYERLKRRKKMDQSESCEENLQLKKEAIDSDGKENMSSPEEAICSNEIDTINKRPKPETKQNKLLNKIKPLKMRPKNEKGKELKGLREQPKDNQVEKKTKDLPNYKKSTSNTTDKNGIEKTKKMVPPEKTIGEQKRKHQRKIIKEPEASTTSEKPIDKHYSSENSSNKEEDKVKERKTDRKHETELDLNPRTKSFSNDLGSVAKSVKDNSLHDRQKRKHKETEKDNSSERIISKRKIDPAPPKQYFNHLGELIYEESVSTDTEPFPCNNMLINEKEKDSELLFSEKDNVDNDTKDIDLDEIIVNEMMQHKNSGSLYDSIKRKRKCVTDAPEKIPRKPRKPKIMNELDAKNATECTEYNAIPLKELKNSIKNFDASATESTKGYGRPKKTFKLFNSEQDILV